MPQKANSDYKGNDLQPRVVVINSEEYTKISQTSKSIELSDVLATIGNVKQSQDAQSDLQKAGYDAISPREGILDNSSAFGGQRFDKDNNYIDEADKGNRIAIIAVDMKDAGKFYQMSPDDVTSKILQHGSIHNANIGHNNEDNHQKTTKKLKDGGKPDITTNGNFYFVNPSKFKVGMNTYDGLKALFQSTGKFTNKAAKDKVFNKEIKYNDDKK